MTNSYMMLFAFAIILVAAVIIFVLRIHYQKIVKEKERGIIRRIREQDRLAKELEHTRVEKELLVNVLGKFINNKT